MKKNFFSTYKSPLSLVIVLIILGGMFSYSRLHTSLFPEITFPKIKIIADAGEPPGPWNWPSKRYPVLKIFEAPPAEAVARFQP